MYKLSPKSIWYVIIRNYMSFRRLFKISIFPNLVDPILFLLAMGIGLGSYIGEINGVSYLIFVTAGLIAATGMMASTAEVTINAFIQMRVEKTYSAVTMTPVNLQDVVIGQVIWASCRSLIYGGMFLVIAAFFGVVQSWTVIFVPFVLLLSGFVFGLMGMIFTSLAPNRDYLNYYSVLFIRPMYMFSDIFFPVKNMPEIVQVFAWFSPLYHAVNLCRGLLLGNFEGLIMNFSWLLILGIILFYIPVIITQKKLAY
ncbi:ABC transporter permease [Sporosarcina sp. ANT_H38]|uniref:ABC transporter permease n=1 Tax=Sporosarcina sp. ANT_H38 TaxID=2597358 RepID=UPI0011F0E732|nr:MULTISPECIES: ABC transporter permease [unclassified Sporosarcina]KAA0940627.1 ABC transporter permease [Sporosarcina sp. ANT_H38]QJS06563.1 ABC transporter permease [Sporosarcina sp.]